MSSSALIDMIKPGRTAWIVLFVCLFPVLVGWYGLHTQEEQVGREQFELQAKEVVGLIEARMRQHEQILLGGAGLFDASTMVSRGEWSTYVSRLRLSENYPGIQGVGFSQLIPPADLKAHVARVRAEGFPEYALRPAGERPLYTSIVYLEPFTGRNLAAFGFDMFSEPTRRAAMTLAAESGRTAISGKVKLVQETHGKPQAGFLMYVPIYRKGILPDSVEARWQALRGFVYSPYRMGDLMQGIVGAHTFGIEFAIHDGSSSDQNALMYSSAEVDEGEVAPKPKYTAQHRIEIFSHGWVISLHSTPAFEAKFNSNYEWMLLSLGWIVALLLFTLTWFLSNRREHAMLLANEMTEQVHRNEEVMRDGMQHTQAIIDNMVDGIITIDRNGTVASFSQAAEKIFGYRADEVVGCNVKMLMPEPYHSAHDGYLHNYLTTGVRRIIGIGREVTGMRKNGSTFPMDLAVSEISRQGQPIFIGIVRDISERKEAAESLRQTSHLLESIFENVPNMIFLKRASDLRFEFFNRAGENLLGISRQNLIGRNDYDFFPKEQADFFTAKDRDVLSRHGVVDIPEEEIDTPAGKRILHTMKLAIRDEAGEPVYLLGISEDITERVKVDRMKSEFVSTVSHELRTPLTSISGALGLVAGGALGELPVQAKEMMVIAHKNSLRLAHLINDLLDMEKLTVGKLHFDMTPQALMPLLQHAIEANRNYGVERQVSLQLHGDVGGTRVLVDDQRLMQVLSNLLSNAIKFSNDGGTVEVGVGVSNDVVRVSVTDHGTGIPQAFRDRIFQKFAQADSSDTRQKGGTGLGLAITRELVEHMQGNIGFESEEGRGSSFYFELPVWHEPQAGGEAVKFAEAGAGNVRLLVVEDDPDVARVLAEMLSRAGYGVDIAADGKRALSALQSRHFDAMTLDMKLPDMNGMEIIRFVRQRPEIAGLPIIVISADMENGALAIKGDYSAIDWLAKPVDDKRLLGVMERLIAISKYSRPRVLHVEDDQDLHRIVRTMVGNRYDFELALTLQEARSRIMMERFDVVILDLTLPDGSGWDLLPLIRQRQPEAHVVILTGSDLSQEEVSRGETVLLKSLMSPQQLLEAISRRIHQSSGKGKPA